ncbi:hypothetical protein HYV69_00975 [Candidatus Uhrbacteria bacterium]|nr:hypothetical protein [Candidatus Uhrbacteria bacterium]
MNLNKQKTKQWISVGLVFVFAFGIVSSVIFSRTKVVQAYDLGVGTELQGATSMSACGASPISPPCIGESVKESMKILNEKVATPAWKIALVQGLLDIGKFVTNRLAYESALIIANGGIGQGSMFYKKGIGEGFADFGKEVAGEAVAELSEGLESGLGLKLGACLPPPDFTLALQLGIAQRYKPQKPRCDIDEVLNNWENFASEIQSAMDPDQANKAILSKFAESLQPGRNELSAAVKINYEVARQVDEKKNASILEQLRSNALKPVKDPTTGQTTTPSTFVEDDFITKLRKLATGEDIQLKASDILAADDPSGAAISGLAMTAASTFTNTLLSELFNKIYKGLFAVTAESSDPFNLEALPDDEESQRDRLSGIFATLPFATTDYNALSEFIICPPEGIANRSVNNCVMNANLMAAISRGNTGVPLTVQEAIDEGLLDGSWKLISSRKLDVNQDPLCYTYSFCYANLVKMRKARILPIGWELAAQANNDTNPKSLKEIVSEFNNCSPNGTIDAAHPFCHLIDPDWVLKYPDSQCRATVNGEIRLTMLSPGRQSVCADAPSCLGEDGNGKCTNGYGYCVSEKNVWRFKGDACAEEYAGCLSMTNTTTKKQNAVIINTVDYSVCGKENAGCQWYRTNRYLDNKGTNTKPEDDTFEWLVSNESFDTAKHESDWRYQNSNGVMTDPTQYTPQNGSSYSVFSYEDRQYFTHAAKECSNNDAGCSELFSSNSSTLNMNRNPSFETDENSDGVPDHWTLQNIAANDLVIEKTKPAARGTSSIKLLQGNGKGVSQLLSVSPNQFYTLSYYAVSETSNPQSADVRLTFLDKNSSPVSLSGLSFVGCTAIGNELVAVKNVETEWIRQSCTFGAPKNASQMKVLLDSTNIRYDAIQIEPKETASTFAEGLKTDGQAQYIKTAPNYLGCEGKATDPAACKAYAQVCASQDVGCNLYNPDDGDPAVSAITSSLDICPNECVGYDAFKQESTLYDDEDFPVHFIPSKAVTCSAQYVGCDSFTNLNIVGEGGEGIEYYTTLRACATPKMTDGSSNKESSTFFTWEGSDNAGYQLRSWVLLESNENDAPCTKWKVNAKDQMICEEDAAYLTTVAADKSCDDHSDIFSNPDCREFFDASGIVHYRKFSKTVTISEECAPYRKDVSTKSDCDTSGGFWDQQVGFCRYFGLTSESNSCPSAQNGCRSYTGGAGRNAVTLLNETFESGSYAGFEKFGSANTDIKISNESIATDGHSLRVSAPAGTKGGFATTQAYLDVNQISTKYDPNNSVQTCSKLGHTVTPAGCEIAPDCVVYSGANSCGPLVNKLVSGKTFVVQFWAKGNGNLQASIVEYGGQQNSVSHDFGGSIALTGNWKVYSLGPFDSSQYSGIEKNSILAFQTDTGKEFFIDNLILKQVEENITIVKDSWVVPSTCDTSPNGAVTPQYYLGCEAYSDKDGKASNLYQFSNLCSEAVVGCEAFNKTFESDSAYSQVFNARCVQGTAGDLAKPSFVNLNTACVVDGKTYCTISTGRSYCTFDYDGTFENKLPKEGDFGIVFGPETVLSPADSAVYIVDNGKADCDAKVAGCREVGAPKYSQDLKKVEGFDSAYFINDPEQYGEILCDNEALFCDEFASTKDGNFYFKDPIKKTCEYRAGVEIEKQKFSGWFRSGTSEPCYWKDINGTDGFQPKADNAYIIAGDQAAIWQNGDSAYDGWVGSCPSSADLCTEFADVTDNEKPYLFLNNDKLDEAATADPDVCKGRVSQKLGCAVFNNRSKSELNYNASASYVVSIHADELLNQSPNALVDPVSCTITGGGEFTLSDASKVDLCQRRCEYNPAQGDSIETSLSQVSDAATNTYVERSCFKVDDCPILETKNGKDIKATNCADVPNFKLENDSNTVLRVVRDRSCSSWLACDSARTSWNERNNKYEQICDSINLCTEGGALGDQSTCTKWSPRDPKILTAYQYSKRDTTWSGSDLSGYAIPNKLPVELYNQFNINPTKACEKNGTPQLNNGFPKECDADKDCASGYSCKEAEPSYRLVNDAGPCKASDVLGSECKVGFCETGGEACGTKADCAGASNNCVIGSCQETVKPADAKTNCVNGDCSCATSADCKTVGTVKYVCDAVTSVCVDKQLGEQNCYAGATNGCTAQQTCVPNATTAIGSCIGGRCLTSIIDSDNNGQADKLKPENYVSQSCRGYPEVDSPYSPNVVEQWATANVEADGKTKAAGFTPTLEADTQTWSRPYTFKTGYQDSQICAPQGNGKFSNCNCSYDKVEYADGTINRFEEVGSSATLPTGFCSGGEFDGHICQSNDDCADKTENPLSSGTCLKQTRRDTLFGWDGYCIEKDSSIQLFASTDPKDQACLTWLPVDQLSGATDLYAKYLSAGFEPEDAYFCGEINVAYDFNTNGYHCAETDGGNCDDEASTDAFQDDDPDEDTYCATGSFAVMAPCGDPSPDDKCTESWGDDDYPYFCVPELSYKTEDDADGVEGMTKKGDRCVVPKTDDVIYSGSEDENGNTIYFMTAGNWKSYKKSYSDCMVRGVFKLSDTYNGYFSGSKSGISLQPYAACETILKVGTQIPDDKGNYNAAWTDRVWKSKQPQYFIQDNYAITIGDKKLNAFGYKASTVPEIFGQAFGITKKLDKETVPDPYPHRVYMCQNGDNQKLATTDGAGVCDADYEIKSGIGEARPYYGIEVLSPLTLDKTLCKNEGCSCAENKDCNFDLKIQASASCGNMVCTGGEFDGKKCDENLGKQYTDTTKLAKCDDLPNQTNEEKETKKNCYAGYSDEVCESSGGSCGGQCVGGAKNGVSCNKTSNCETQTCDEFFVNTKTGLKSVTQCVSDESLQISILENPPVSDLVVSRLKQLFAYSYDLLRFENDGVYTDENTNDLLENHDDLEAKSNTAEEVFKQEQGANKDSWMWDERAKNGEPPTVVSLGACVGAKCKEGTEGAFTVNDQDEGDILAKGSKRANVSFFTYANTNQMPIRNIVVDWGDGEDITAGGMPWPTDSQSGSNASDNFYKNHRGLSTSGNEICRSDADTFGESPEACSSGYVVFSHDYACSQADVNKLSDRECEFANDGRLINSPCLSSTKEGKAACVFQPRVHVKDNWGWCTGFCDAGSDGKEGCYAGEDVANDECQINVCPSEGKLGDCPDSLNNKFTDNPWVNYDGTIIVEVE